MRPPTLDSPTATLRRGTALTMLSFALAAGLAGCDGTGPTEPGVAPSMDPAPVTLHQPTIPMATAASAARR